MSETKRTLEVLLFAVAMLLTDCAATWYGIYGLGHSEGAIGTELQNLKFGALFLLPVVALASGGYCVGRFRRGAYRTPRALVITSGYASGALMWAGLFVAPLIHDSVLSIVAFGAYCFMLGAVSGILISRGGAAANGAV